MVKVSAIIPAAGSGSRFGEEKQFKILSGRPLWAYTLDPFIKSSLINESLLKAVGKKLNYQIQRPETVSYTHLTLPTNREV